MTAYPTPNLIIKKVEQFGKANPTPDAFDFLDRNVMSYSWKHKINTKSSSKPELVRVDNSLVY